MNENSSAVRRLYLLKEWTFILGLPATPEGFLRAKAYGRVVVTSSNSGIYGNFGQSNYGGAKLAELGLCKDLDEGAELNFTVPVLAITPPHRMPVPGSRAPA